MNKLANAVLMVRPFGFGFNEETASDNFFQHRAPNNSLVEAQALQEFSNMVERLESSGLRVCVLEKASDNTLTPDAVFPNNWISTEPDGTVVVYPMAAPNRAAERRRLNDVLTLFQNNNLSVSRVIDLSIIAENRVLEGTGSLVVDRATRTPYVAQSSRSDPKLAQVWADILDFRTVCIFETQDARGYPIYHTNVALSIGQGFAVLCSECIPNPAQRHHVLTQLSQSHEVIEITLPQMTHFCGNILQVQSIRGEPLIVMSDTAFNAFSRHQRTQLSNHGTLLNVGIPTVERIGGGSARCMMAEVFLNHTSPSVRESL
ncbi:MAG: arginine deiminase-related protein [Deinococcaceae bacterium]